MNAVEIEEAISALAERPFDPEEFPYAFLEAFGNKETTLKRLRKGESNKFIAYKLGMGECTVKVHIRNVMRKINARSRTEVAFMTNDLFDA